MSLIFDITKRRTALNGDGLALREVATGQEITYSELNTRADLFAVALRGALGRAQGDRVGILTHNNAAFFEILFACGKAGVILVPLNWRLTPSELAPLLEDAGIDVLLHDHNCAELSHSLAASRDLQLVPIHTRGDAPTPGSYQALMAEADPAHAPVRDDGWAAEDTWYMLYTSGTTGIPKAVRQTFGMAMANYVNVTQTFGLSVTSRSPNFLPLFHTAGVNLHSMPILISGGTVDVLPGFDPPQVSLFPLVTHNADINGIYVGSRAMFGRMNAFLSGQGIRPVIDEEYRFDDALKAYASLEGAGHFGKIVVKV